MIVKVKPKDVVLEANYYTSDITEYKWFITGIDGETECYTEEEFDKKFNIVEEKIENE